MEDQELPQTQASAPFLLKAARLGPFIAIAVTGIFFTFEVISLFTAPIVGTYSGDETVSYYMAARNFNTYGFLNSTLLQDFSTSSAADEHPFVYDHMTAGPEIIVALLMRVAGENYWVSRLFFAVIFVGGLYFLYRFTALFLQNLGLQGAGYAFLLFWPVSLMYLMDSPGHATFPLLAFYPLVAMHRWHKTGKAGAYWSALGAVLLSTCVLPYQQVILILSCTFFLAVFKLFAVTKRDALVFTLTAAAGVVVHVVQNVGHLGVDLAIKELWFTISNRMTGHPTGQELVEFYQSINVVHHGAHSFQLEKLFWAFFDCINLRVIKMLAAAGGVLLVWRFVAKHVASARSTAACGVAPANSVASTNGLASVKPRPARVAGWCLASVFVPVFAFPAYAVDYNLQGTGKFLGAIAGLVLLIYVVRAIVSLPLKSWALAGCLASLGLVFLVYFERQARSVVHMGQQAFVNEHAFLDQIAARTRNQVTMTNLYPAFVGFFTREKVFGVAELDAFTSDGQPYPYGAYNKFIPHIQTADHHRPTHYILSRVLLPGHARSTDEEYFEQLRQFLLAHHRLIYEDKSLAIFELVWN